MATLTETAHYSRLAIKYGAIALVVLIVGRFTLVNGYKLYMALFPPLPEPPSMGFGPMPEIVFPEVETATKLTYKLETPTGKLPILADRLAVFQVVVQQPSLLTLERAREGATRLGYTAQPEQVSSSVYRWKKSEPVAATLNMHITRGTFTISVDWAAKPEFLTQKQMPAEVRAVETAKNVLKRANMLESDIEGAEQRITYLKAFGKELKPTISLSEADFVQIDLFRRQIGDNYAAMTTNPDKGVIRAIVSGNARLADITYLEYNYYPVEYGRQETYPLIPVSQAWQTLESGDGFVARLDDGVENVTVRRVGLAYLDTFEPQLFLQPVYVFTGDNKFVGYVPAIGTIQR